MKSKIDKSILLLGGSSYLIPLIRVCKKYGIKVYTADYLPDNIAHKYSDGYFNVSVVDKEAVLALAKYLNVDGINAFATDAGVISMAYVAEKLNLPCAGSYSAIDILQTKPKFREFLKSNGFNTPKFKGYKSITCAINEIQDFNFPIMVKPSDSAGSKGIRKVSSINEFQDACQFALKYSIKKEFIVEEFIEKIGCSSDTDCFSVDGKLKYFTTNSQYFDSSSPGEYAPCAYIYPSLYPEEVNVELKSELQRLILLLGLKTSVYNVETRIGTDGRVYIMEFTPRGGGNRLSEMVRYAYGVDFIEATVLHSVGEDFNLSRMTPNKTLWTEIILHSPKSGVFEGIEIDEKISNFIIELDLLVKTGEEVEAFSSANKMVGTAILNITDINLFQYVRHNIHKLVQVRVK
ncbi:MAG: ATP-grasp domain-containing protein [Bacteroidales bacterium]|nr:ATP-grasp domain-containing protein [Bacteroidales bacterium]